MKIKMLILTSVVAISSLFGMTLNIRRTAAPELIPAPAAAKTAAHASANVVRPVCFRNISNPPQYG